MSGIAAIIDFEGDADLVPAIRQMTEAMAYRGPDGIDHWHRPGAAFGFCAMHTTAEATRSRQPLVSADGRFVAMFDGYLFNHADLLAQLQARGEPIPDPSDAAVALAAWLAWGEDCPDRLEGEFAFVVWDTAEKTLFACRDHQGLRPLYYAHDGGRLIVASEIAAILAALERRPLPNRGYLAELAAAEFLSHEDTVWEGVMRLPQASQMLVRRQGARVARYWQLPLGKRLRYPRDEDYIEHYRELLIDCVARASRTHRPLACEVSGGLDSSAIFAVAHQLQAQGRLPAPSLRGYTMTAPPGTRADESCFLDDLESFLDVEIIRSPLAVQDFGWFLDQAAGDCDVAGYPNMTMSIGMGQRMVADGSRVAINGQGGDLWLNGSPYYYYQAMREGRLADLLHFIRADHAARGAGAVATGLLRHGLVQFVSPRLRRALRQAFYRREETAGPPWLAPELRQELAERRRALAIFCPHREGFKVPKLEHAILPRLFELFSRQSARLGFESRSPMLSRRFIEACVQMPEHVRFRAGCQKWIHRSATKNVLPRSIVERGDKAEFTQIYESQELALTNLFGNLMISNSLGLIDTTRTATVPTELCAAKLDGRLTWQVWGSAMVYGFLQMQNLNLSHGGRNG